MLQDPKFWVAASFVIFIVLFGKMAWSRATAMLDARGERIRAELEEASRLRHEAEAMLAQAQAEREAATAEAAAMIERAQAEAQRLAIAAAAEAEAAAKRRERMAMDRIAAAEASAVTEVRNAAAEIATAAVRDIIVARHDATADAALIDSAVASLPVAFRAA
ncbi:F0F1 ATP synthase subunit B [Sediminicoccus sp. BL-A-41-H5]|uniref:F0F1 ATP synthase subunit B family protein n=1 Tax=Sediminicoccus sp. BL-A-41-H5 TaxID=3421106 RepID=UPI003D67970B